MSTQNPLQQFKAKLKKQKKIGLALDIDETLSWTIGHWFESLHKTLGNPENLTVHEMVAKYRYAENVPAWQTEEGFALMDKYRSSNRVQEKLPLIEDADSYVHKIHKKIPIVAYITVRPQEVIGGTKKWLRRHGFPQAEVIARPSHIKHADGNKWKAKAIEELYPQVIGIVDDNPKLVQELSSGYKGTVYLYDNTESPRNDIDVTPCKNWPEVLRRLK